MTDADPIESSQKDAKAKNRLAALTENEDVIWLMSNKRGRRIVNRLLDRTGVYRLSFHTNALQMAFNEGNRNLGNSLLAQITVLCPERYTELLNEARDKNE